LEWALKLSFFQPVCVELLFVKSGICIGFIFKIK